MKVIHAQAANKIFGDLYIPEHPAHPRRVLIVMGGSDGKYELTQKLAQAFCAKEIAAFACGYWNVPDMPAALNEVPVEEISFACEWLRTQGYEQFGLYGVSKGAEFALTAAGHLQEISCVIAVNPIDHVMEGLTADKKLTKTSSWSIGGKGLDFVPLKLNKLRLAKNYLLEKQVNMRFVYERPLQSAADDTVIPVWQTGGPVLLISARNDTMWPSNDACLRMMKRLAEKGFSYPYRHLEYEYASHLLIPAESGMEKFFRIEKTHPGECRKSKEDSLKQAVEWLVNVWE